MDRSDNDLRAGDVGSVLECGDAEVSKLDCAIACQEDVLWLDIPVDDSVGMCVHDSAAKLIHDVSGF